MSINHLRTYLGALLFCFLLSCQEEQTPNTRNIEPASAAIDTLWISNTTSHDIIVKDGILHFATPEIYDHTLTSMQEKTTEEMLRWSSEIGFTSMQSAFQDLLNEQSSLYEEMAELENQASGLSSAELNYFINLNSNQISLLKAKKAKLLAKTADFKVQEGIISEMRIHDFFASAVVNPQGLVVVANNLLQYTEDQLKIIPYIDEGSISKIRRANANNESERLFVENIKSTSINSRTQNSIEREEYCSFTYDPDHSGDNYGNAVLEVVKIRKAVYKTVYQTNCECVQLLPPRDRDKENEEICAVYECERVPVRVFSRWKNTELRVSGELRTYGRSCGTWSIFTGCSVSPSAANLFIQVSSSSSFVLPNNSKLLSKNNVSIIGFTKSYNLTASSAVPRNITLNYGALNTNSGGLGNCTINISTGF